MVEVVIRVEAVFTNALVRVRGVHELAVAGVDPHVGDAVAVGVLEEDEVAGAKVLAADGRAVIVLLFSGPGKVDAVGSSEDVADERRAVEAGSRCTTKHIAGAAERVGSGDDVAGADRDVLLGDANLTLAVMLGAHRHSLFVSGKSDRVVTRLMRRSYLMRRLDGCASLVDMGSQLNRRGVSVLSFDAGVGRVGRDDHRRAQAVDITSKADRGVVAVVSGDVDGRRVLGRGRRCALGLMVVMPGMSPGAGGNDSTCRQNGGCRDGDGEGSSYVDSNGVAD